MKSFHHHLVTILTLATLYTCVQSSREKEHVPKVTLPPCTDSLCITPCGFSEIDSFSLNVSGIPVDKLANSIHLKVTARPMKLITSLKFRLENIEIDTILGYEHLNNNEMDFCQNQVKRKAEIQCPIKPNQLIVYETARQIGWLKNMLKGGSVTIKAIDQDGVVLACVDVTISIFTNK
ncbi:uncharacterized protein LOC134181176 [Corticium candelabrum]|uniref:uncharacterized protein LOC134181176 n=1 Tax=Corticium candelabrum TaxID=121492 RepID=UPI002E26CADA|nr:uncharacterized protein LOC134181176 [Corticium candelabrum]